ncbi:hypothetical protein GCM10011608_40590 [Micromonospora sonchi]|uniref:Uncharacterized protein n=1 Tax=Micromonospora sonchi TaxID=1763543 RepID=A0A917X1D4_9ACTN|nr:hypothetical protein GCM10011608_40590 [Micromonospora sonchi]
MHRPQILPYAVEPNGWQQGARAVGLTALARWIIGTEGGGGQGGGSTIRRSPRPGAG